MLQFQMKRATSSENEESSEEESSSDEDEDDNDDECDANESDNDLPTDLTQDLQYSQDAQHSPVFEDSQSQSLLEPKTLPVSSALPPLPSMAGLFSKPSTSGHIPVAEATPKSKKGRKGEIKKSKVKKKKTNSPEMVLFAEVGSIYCILKSIHKIFTV